MKISRNSWHYKLMDATSLRPPEHRFNTACQYFWGLVGRFAIIAIPLACLGGFLFLLEGLLNNLGFIVSEIYGWEAPRVLRDLIGFAYLVALGLAVFVLRMVLGYLIWTPVKWVLTKIGQVMNLLPSPKEPFCKTVQFKD